MDYAALQAENQTLRARTTELEEQLVSVRGELAEHKRLVFGSKRERFIGLAGQGQLSLLADEALTVSATRQPQTYHGTKSTTGTMPPSRKMLPAHLPRVEVVLEPDVAGTPVDTSVMKKIGEQVSEELDRAAAAINRPSCLYVATYDHAT